MIGGSIALALRSRRSRPWLLGVDRPSVLDRARDRGLIDEGMSVSALLRRVRTDPPDIIVLALPIPELVHLVPRLAKVARALPPGRRPLILDVGSVKRTVIAAASACACPRFVGGHPLAGLERGGIEQARADLFRGSTFALCPIDGSTADLRDARAFVERLGARPVVIDAAEHDRMVALTSHLPHLTAWALMEAATRLQARLPTPRALWELSAGSWSDATRVAAADPQTWGMIVHHNEDAVLESLDLLLAALGRIRAGLVAGANVLEPGPHGVDGTKLARLARLRARRRAAVTNA